MRSLEDNLTQYAAYHRDRRNITTHFVGVPMIVFAILLALSSVPIPSPMGVLTLAVLASIAVGIYYFQLDLVFGVLMGTTLVLMCLLGQEIAGRLGVAATLGWALALFVAGWALQFLGHKYEGVKPAFYDDAKQLLIGPLFVCAEALFSFGAMPELRRCIEDRVGPTVARRDGRALPLA